MAYTLAATVKIFAQVKHTQLQFAADADLDTFLTDTLIPKAQEIINQYCNHRFDLHLVDYHLDGSGKRTLWLPPEFCPPNMFGTITVNGVAVAISDIHLSEQFIQWAAGSFISSSPKGIHLIGSAGYTTIPTAIQYVTDQICANVLIDMVRRNVAPNVFKANLATDAPDAGYTSVFASPRVFTKELKQMCDEYRIVWVDLG